METQALIDQIKAIDTPEAMTAIAAIVKAMPGKMAPEIQKAFIDKLAEINAKSKQDRQEIVNTLRLHGVDYPLSEWLTPKNYALKFGVKSTETVINWINRGVISEDNVKEIPELGLRLVRAIEYSPRKYATK